MKRPSWGVSFFAWWYRNITYRDRVIEFVVDYKRQFPLFELVSLHNGIEAYYLGDNKFLPKGSRQQFFDENINLTNIPKYELSGLI